jgi:hypothetical protein
MSGWNSKKSMSKYRFTWTQPYQIQPIQYSSVSKEMAIIEAIDRLIDSGLTYPELGTIIKHIANNTRSNPNA